MKSPLPFVVFLLGILQITISWKDLWMMKTVAIIYVLITFAIMIGWDSSEAEGEQ